MGHLVELSPQECLAFLCKLLWMPDGSEPRPRLPVLDLLVYHLGTPANWLFTSRKTGEIMKKKAVRLSSVGNIVSSFKKLFHTYIGTKPPELKTKIAVVWYITSSGLASYLVDEVEMTNLLSTTPFEVLAIQLYIGGYSVKGNGIFEHRVNKLTKTGSVKYQTLENSDPDDPQLASVQFTQKCRQLIILEHQHELLRSLSTLLTRYIEGVTGAKVVQMAFLAVFNSTWTPFLVTVKAITLSDAPEIFFESRERCIYPMGSAPMLPPLPQRSLLLPTGVDAAHEAIAKLARPISANSLASNRPQSTNSHMRSRSAYKIIGLDEVAPPTASEEEQQPPALSATNPTNPSFEGTAVTVSQNQYLAGKPRPRSAPFSSKLAFSVDTAERRLGRSKSHSNSALRVGTDASHNRMNFEHVHAQAADDGSPKGLQTFLPVRRPISAPHVSMERRSARATPSAASEATTPQSTPGLVYDDDEARAGINNPFIYRSLPLAGVTCFGDYCQFIDQINQNLRSDEMGSSSQPSLVSLLPPQTQATAPPTAPAVKSAACPFRLAQKSILLARQEIQFTGLPLDDKVHSWVLRLKLGQMDPSQLYAYFVRRHLNTVAQKCQEEARRLAMSITHTPLDMWQDLNVVYRRLVYAEALGQVHASRFYYTVPVCEVCYKIYVFMDEQRDGIILHNPEQSKALDAKKNIASSVVSDPEDIFHRLYYGEGSRPRSAQSHGRSSKLRLAKLIKENGGAQGDAEDEDSARAPTLKPDKKRRPSSASSVARSTRSADAKPAALHDIVRANIDAVVAHALKPEPRSIFTYVHAASAARIPPTALSPELTIPPPLAAEPPAVDKGETGRLAAVYGYSSLPFEAAPQLSATSIVRASAGPRRPSTSSTSSSTSSPNPPQPPEVPPEVVRLPSIRIQLNPNHSGDAELTPFDCLSPPTLPAILEESSDLFPFFQEGLQLAQLEERELTDDLHISTSSSLAHMDLSQSLSPSARNLLPCPSS